MGHGLRKLPAHVEEKHGSRLTLAESFSDPQLHEWAQIIKCTRMYRSTQEGSEHWSVEDLNHSKRDASYWREDQAPGEPKT